MDFVRLIGVTKSLMKRCVKKDCAEFTIHGYPVSNDEFLCHRCGEGFIKALENDRQRGVKQSSGMRSRKYVEADLRAYIALPKGTDFTPSIIADDDHVVTGYDVFYRKQIEVVDSGESSSSENMEEVLFSGTAREEARRERDREHKRKMKAEKKEWKQRIQKIEDDWNARCTTFQDRPEFAAVFRKLLEECSEETLKEIMRCGEFHATHHDSKNCEGCEDSDEGAEFEHQLRTLGALWMKTVDILHLQLPKTSSGTSSNEDSN